jgi:hypothetical protein
MRHSRCMFYGVFSYLTIEIFYIYFFIFSFTDQVLTAFLCGMSFCLLYNKFLEHTGVFLSYH